jgi:hypothetical protein
MLKKKAIVIGLGVLVLVLLGFVAIYCCNLTLIKQAEFSLSPETIVQSTNPNPITLNFDLKFKGGIPVFSTFLKTRNESNSKIPLIRHSDGTFTGNFQVPIENLQKSQTLIFDLYINGMKSSKIARFAITDISTTLPPDPGEAGKATLEGLDSDHDGVRDDLQREIVFMYPDRDEVRRLLRAEMKIKQQILTTSGDHNYFVGLFERELNLDGCYTDLIFLDKSKSDIREYVKESDFWQNLFKNTKARKERFETNYYIATPFANVIGTCKEVQGQY